MTTRLALLSFALVLGVPSGALADVFSPGDLTKQHAELEGIRNCRSCHPEGGQLSQATCLECHAELKGRVAKGLGFHGRIADEQRKCETCHKEHQGRDYALVSWGKEGQAGFDHQRAGWPLKGKHKDTKCEGCHEKRRIAVPAIQQLLQKNPARLTFLGLRTGCEACHFDEHRGQMQYDCDYCHREAEWKKVPGFNHDETKYPLKGKHAPVACEKCHPKASDPHPGAFPAPVSETFLKFSQLDFAQCSDCHKDPHEGGLGPRCSSCHTVEGWKLIRDAAAERGFHEKTRFPLKGGHLDVACNLCHGPFPGQGPKFKNMAFQHCADCHADAHEGQLAPQGGKAPDCAECHFVDGFAPVKFAPARHEKTRYPLEGGHRFVACNACHLRTPALLEKVPPAVWTDLKRKHLHPLFSTFAFDFQKPLEACESCHKDPHQGQFDGRSGGCRACHQVDGFKTLKFDHDRDSEFPLAGKHRDVPCVKCHAPARAGDPLAFTDVPTTCEACHADPHVRQFADKKCDACHIEQSFKELRFKHEAPFTRFRLEGRHAEVPCARCHLLTTVPGAKPVQRFRGIPQECEGCHTDFHRGAFKGFEPP